MKKITLLGLLLLCLATACKEGNKQTYLPASIGPINSLAVVMDNELWRGSVGDKVREHFAAPISGLVWDEPQFTINHIPTQVFSGSIRTTRAILFISKDTLNTAHIKSNLYAGPQKVAVIKGNTEAEIIANIEAKALGIITAFKDLEIGEAQKRFKRSLNKEKALEDNFGIRLEMPSVYKVGKQEDNFVWIDRQIPKGTMNIVAYTMPADSFKNDSTFVRDIVKMRDSIGKTYIPGPDVPGKTTYMITEKAFAPHVYPSTIGGLKAAEVKGIWEMSGDFMAGPFLTYIINDPNNDRKLILEGFTYAPATSKRDYMFELEAILKSIQFITPAD